MPDIRMMPDLGGSSSGVPNPGVPKVPQTPYAGLQTQGYGPSTPSYVTDTFVRTAVGTPLYVNTLTGAGTFTDGVTGASLTLGNGNDSTGNGTLLTPYATISKALSVANSNGTQQIIVAPGTYQESTGGAGRMIPKGNFSAFQTVRGLTFVPSTGAHVSDVVVQGTSGNAGEFTASSSNTGINIEFWGITVTQRATTTNPGIVSFNSTTAAANGPIRFTQCVFNFTALSAGTAYLFAYASDGGCGGCVFDQCTLVGVASTDCAIVNAGMFTSGGTPMVGFRFTNNKLSSFQGNWSQTGSCGGFTNPVVYGNDLNYITPTSAFYGILLGRDALADAKYTVTGAYVGGNYVKHATAHLIILGSSSQGEICEFNRGDGGLHGIVVKEHTVNSPGTWIRNNEMRMTAGSATDAYYNKASINVNFVANLAYSNISTCALFKEDIGTDGGSHQPGFSCWVNNRGISDGSSSMFSFTATSQGNDQVGYNYYELRGSSTWGSVRGVSISSLASLQAAWVSAGIGTETTSGNDLTSSTSAGLQYAHYISGVELYGLIMSNAGQFWNGSGLENFNSSYPWRYRRFSWPRNSDATTYGFRIPIDLPNTSNYTVIWYLQAGDLPNPATDTRLEADPLSYSL